FLWIPPAPAYITAAVCGCVCVCEGERSLGIQVSRALLEGFIPEIIWKTFQSVCVCVCVCLCVWGGCGGGCVCVCGCACGVLVYVYGGLHLGTVHVHQLCYVNTSLQL